MSTKDKRLYLHKPYFNGDLAKYTGESIVLHGARWFEVVMLEGHLKGQIKHLSQCPDCGLVYYQNQPAIAPCFTCMVEPDI